MLISLWENIFLETLPIYFILKIKRKIVGNILILFKYILSFFFTLCLHLFQYKLMIGPKVLLSLTRALILFEINTKEII